MKVQDLQTLLSTLDEDDEIYICLSGKFAPIRSVQVLTKRVPSKNWQEETHLCITNFKADNEIY